MCPRLRLSIGTQWGICANILSRATGQQSRDQATAAIGPLPPLTWNHIVLDKVNQVQDGQVQGWPEEAQRSGRCREDRTLSATEKGVHSATGLRTAWPD